jgi:dihydropteroate synthase
LPTARTLSANADDILRSHLIRLGMRSQEVDAAAGRVGQVQILLTGAKPEGLAALMSLRGERDTPVAEDYPHVIPGDRDRAKGTALISGRREEVERLGRALALRGPEASMVAAALREALSSGGAILPATRIGKKTFEWGARAYVMGIVNVTPDSFFDGGRFFGAEEAVAHGERLAHDGADLLDVGGESTRPGANAVSAEEEIDRVVPVIEQLARRVEVPISVDTTKARVAEAAVRAGASMVNDISGFKFDLDMAPTLSRLEVAACAMHIQGTPRTMQQSPTYFDVGGEVIEHLAAALSHAQGAGVRREQLLVDPGIGFGKTVGHNLYLLRHLPQLRALGRPVVVGASRKSFLGKLTSRDVGDRLAGSLAAVTAAILHGADIVRVHDVRESVDAARVAEGIRGATDGGFSFAPA